MSKPITWSGGANFSGTFTTLPWSMNILSIPSGQVPPPPGGTFDYVTAVLVFTIVIQATGGNFTLVAQMIDSSGAPVDSEGVVALGSGSPFVIGLSFMLYDHGLTHGLNGGMTLRLADFVGHAQSITGTVVACLIHPNQDDRGAYNGGFDTVYAQQSGALTGPATGTAVFSSPVVFYDTVFGIASGRANGTPSAPSVESAPGWTNVIQRVNGQLTAGIGVYDSWPAHSVSAPFALDFPSGRVQWMVGATSYLGIPPPPLTRSRAFAQIIG